MEITFAVNTPSCNQKRKSGTKVRSGCSTCKTRHLKCDEKKPHCDKCVSTGRKCPGYDVFIHTKTPQASSLLRIKPTGLLPDATEQERRHFDMFRKHVVHGFCGIFDGSWWSPYVLGAAVLEPMILHAALAFASVNEPTSRNETFTLQQYSKSMTRLQGSLAKADVMDPSILLLTTLILACLGFARNRHNEAMMHLQGGAAILSRIEDSPSMTSGIVTKGDGPECCLVNAFRRLDLTTTLSISTKPFPNMFPYWISQKRRILEPVQLNDVSILRARLDQWVTEVVSLIHDTQKLNENNLSLFQDDYFIQSRMREMYSASNQWLHTFNHMFMYTIPAIPTNGAKEQAEKAATLLSIHHRSASVMLATSLSEGRESVFDDHLNDFKAVVEMATTLAPYFRARPKAFTLDVGVIPTLHYTVTKCRDPVIRHQALDLLSSMTHREGAWDGRFAARSAARVIKIEERAATALMPGAIITEASQIPEIARVHDAQVDIEGSESLLHCKRRRFESDGQWESWVVKVD